MTNRTDPVLPALPERLQTVAIRPDSPDYGLMRSSYMRVGSPALVLRVRNEDEVREAVAYAADARAKSGGNLPFAIRSGGHGISGQSTNDGGIVIDLSQMRRIEIVDPARALIRVQAGAVWGEVAGALAKNELALTSGNAGASGVGGLAGSGGIGYMARFQGMTLDHIRSARLVTADGTIREVYRESEPDLFWAVRGGASQIGVVTEYMFEAGHLPGADMIQQKAQHFVDDVPAFAERWGELLRNAPREFTSFLMLHRYEDKVVSIATNVWWGKDVAKARPTIEAFAGLDTLAGHQAHVTPYPNIIVGGRSHNVGQQTIKMRDGLVDRVDRKLGDALDAVIRADITAVTELRSVGGAVNDVASDACAYPHRHQEGLVSFWCHPVSIEAIDTAWKPLNDLSTGMYSFYSSDTRPSAASLSWPGATGDRLRKIANTVDPNGLFTDGLSVRAVDA